MDPTAGVARQLEQNSDSVLDFDIMDTNAMNPPETHPEQQAITAAHVAMDAATAAANAANAAQAAEQAVQHAHFTGPPQSHYLGKLFNKPEVYDGKDRGLAADFVSKIRLYIAANIHLFTTERDKVFFAASYLRGKAYTWIQPRLDKEVDPVMMNFETFVDSFIRNLGDPDREATMTKKIKLLRQTSSCTTYRTEFDSYAQYLSINEPGLREYFYDGLKDSVKDVLATIVDQPDSLLDFEDLCVRIDNRLFERKTEHKGQSKPSHQSHVQSTLGPSVHFNPYRSKPKPALVSSPRATYSSSGPAPMDLDASHSGRKFKPLTPEERTYRMNNSLCLYCGKAGHRATDCPAKKRPAGRLQATLTGPADSANLSVN